MAWNQALHREGTEDGMNRRAATKTTSPASGRAANKAERFFHGYQDKMRIMPYWADAIFDTAGYNENLDQAVTAPD